MIARAEIVSRLQTMFTIGHSTLPIAVFVGALKDRGVQRLVDVRTVPRSRHNPQFGTEELAASLAESGIEYCWMAQLGGLRRARKDSINVGWRNLNFRGYADYMQTETFAAALTELASMVSETPTAIMCAEAVPWRCHRSLIADAMVVRKYPVEDIFVSAAGKATSNLHKLTPFAKVEGTRLWYPENPAQEELPLLGRILEGNE